MGVIRSAIIILIIVIIIIFIIIDVDYSCISALCIKYINIESTENILNFKFPVKHQTLPIIIFQFIKNLIFSVSSFYLTVIYSFSLERNNLLMKVLFICCRSNIDYLETRWVGVAKPWTSFVDLLSG